MRYLFALMFLGGLSLMPIASAATSWATCQAAGVMEHPNRVHVRCAQPTGGISYFAVSTQDRERAARFQDLATAALVHNKTLVINYDGADTSGNNFGCASDNCRAVLMMELR